MTPAVSASGPRPGSSGEAIAWASLSVILAPVMAGTLPKLAVQVEGRADEREVREGLREVSQELARPPDLLGVEPEVIRVREHLFEGEARLVQPPRARECLDVPERADRERPLLPFEAVLELARVVAVHE